MKTFKSYFVVRLVPGLSHATAVRAPQSSHPRHEGPSEIRHRLIHCHSITAEHEKAYEWVVDVEMNFEYDKNNCEIFDQKAETDCELIFMS